MNKKENWNEISKKYREVKLGHISNLLKIILIQKLWNREPDTL